MNNNNRIGPTRNPGAAGAGDARTATPTPAGAQEHLESPPGFPARRPRSPGDDDSSRNVRPRQVRPQVSELQIIPLGPSSFPDNPGFQDIAPRFLQRQPSSAGLVELPLARSPRGNWLASALQDMEAALRERAAAHPGTGPSAPQATVHQAFAQQRRWRMDLPGTAGMPPLSVRLEKTTSFQITVGRSNLPPGGGNPVRWVPPGQSPLRLAGVRELPIPAGDDALIGQLTEAQPPDPQVRKKQIALHRLANWLHESGNEGLEKLRAQSPETRQKVVNDFLADQARRHSTSDSVVEPAPREIVNILHDGLQALEGVREASASTAVVTSSQQPSSKAETDPLIRRHF
jgi:hypothetical protein